MASLNKIGHIARCKCKLCTLIKNKTEESVINSIEKYYLKALVKCFKFNKIRNKKSKKLLYIKLTLDQVCDPWRHRRYLINCRKCKQLKAALKGYRFKCTDCSQVKAQDCDYIEWSTWGHSVIS
jgi:hypothetical protein